MQLHRDVVTDPYGNAVAAAEVAVLDTAGNLATLYDADGAALINPFATDDLGSFAFQAANGRYTIRITGAGLPTREIPDVILQDPAQLLTAGDLLYDFVASGLLPAVPNPVSLAMTTPAGVAYINGTRVAPAATAKAYTASRDTYVDLSATGAFTYIDVANGAGAPAVTANSVRLFKAVTNGTEVTAVTDLREIRLIPKPTLLAYLQLPVFTVATLPDAATYRRCLIYVSDETGGAVPAFSDSTNWRRVTDRAVVA